MGSNMQRQAVPLIQADAPLVGTGMEAAVARDSGATIIGVVALAWWTRSTGARIVVRATNEGHHTKGVDIYRLRKFMRSNQVHLHQPAPAGQGGRCGCRTARSSPIGPSTELGELALGRNVLCAFMPWNGYNFEDSILISERIARDGRVHLIPHRGIRGDGARHQAWPGGDHPRHPECRRGSAEEHGRGRHRPISVPK